MLNNDKGKNLTLVTYNIENNNKIEKKGYKRNFFIKTNYFDITCEDKF